MAHTEQALSERTKNADGERTITPAFAIAATRRQLDDELEVSDAEIWRTWQLIGGGPTNRDDLGRVVAQLEGIALDG